jgi:hypothetical protein
MVKGGPFAFPAGARCRVHKWNFCGQDWFAQAVGLSTIRLMRANTNKWRELTKFDLAQGGYGVIAGFALAAGLIIGATFEINRSVKMLDGSVKQLDKTVKLVGAAQGEAEKRLEAWNKLLIVLTSALALLTVALLVVTLQRGAP